MNNGKIYLSAPASSGSTSYYGSFTDSTAQTIPTPYQLAKVNIGTTLVSSGITIGSGTDIVFANAGWYDIQFSLQVTNFDTQAHDFYLWLQYLGSTVANTASAITVPSTHAGGNGHVVPAWNFFVQANAGDNYNLAWTSDSIQVQLENITTPVIAIPSIPSVILTVNSI